MNKPLVAIFTGAPLWFALGAIADPTGRRVVRIAEAQLIYGDPADEPCEPSQLAQALVARVGLRSRAARNPEDDPALDEAITMACVYIRRLEDIARQHGALLRTIHDGEPNTTNTADATAADTPPRTPPLRETDRHGNHGDQGQEPSHNDD